MQSLAGRSIVQHRDVFDVVRVFVDGFPLQRKTSNMKVGWWFTKYKEECMCMT